MATRVEITKKYAAAYEKALKRDKSRILDHLVEVTGWNRDHARQQLAELFTVSRSTIYRAINRAEHKATRKVDV